MVSTLKENPRGGFYCSECRMSTSEPVEVCPFCGSIISNWMDVIIKQENDRIRPMFDLDPETGENKFAIRGQRLNILPVEDSSLIDMDSLKELIIEMKVKDNESNIYGRD